jgi:hypothetical protein
MNIKKFAQIAKKLDKSGNYIVADKIDKYLKLSQAQNLVNPGMMPSKRFQPNLPGFFGNAVSLEGLTQGSQGLALLPDAAFVDPFKSSVYRGRGSEKGYVQSDYITPEEFARLSKTQAGRDEIKQRAADEAKRQTAYLGNLPSGAEQMVQVMSNFLQSGLDEASMNDVVNNFKPAIIKTLENNFSNVDPSTWDNVSSNFRQSLPSQFSGYADEFIKSALKGAVMYRVTKKLPVPNEYMSMISQTVPVTPNQAILQQQSPQTAQAPTQQLAPASPQFTTTATETPDQKQKENGDYQRLLSVVQNAVPNKDVVTINSIWNEAKNTFKNKERLENFRTQITNLANRNGMNISLTV